MYCRSDAACLCLSCDRNVHSANALSKRHSRTLLCERCNSQPACVRCAEERVSLCQNCDWIGHGASTSASTHKRQPLNCYSGCPSAAELSSIWSFVLDFPSGGESACEKGMGLMSIAEGNENAACIPPKDSSSQDVSVCADDEAGNANAWVGSSSLPELKSASLNMGQLAASASTATPKACLPITRSPGLFEDDRFYEDFNMDEVDLDLENYDELFGVALTNSELLFENGGIDSLFGAKEMSAADSNCQGPVVAEVYCY